MLALALGIRFLGNIVRRWLAISPPHVTKQNRITLMRHHTSYSLSSESKSFFASNNTPKRRFGLLTSLNACRHSSLLRLRDNSIMLIFLCRFAPRREAANGWCVMTMQSWKFSGDHLKTSRANQFRDYGDCLESNFYDHALGSSVRNIGGSNNILLCNHVMQMEWEGSVKTPANGFTWFLTWRKMHSK